MTIYKFEFIRQGAPNGILPLPRHWLSAPLSPRQKTSPPLLKKLVIIQLEFL